MIVAVFFARFVKKTVYIIPRLPAGCQPDCQNNLAYFRKFCNCLQFVHIFAEADSRTVIITAPLAGIAARGADLLIYDYSFGIATTKPLLLSPEISGCASVSVIGYFTSVVSSVSEAGT